LKEEPGTMLIIHPGKSIISERVRTIKGYLYVVAAAVMWASSGTAGKALFEGGVSPFEVTQIRVTFGSALLAIVLAFVARDAFGIRKRDVGYFFVLGSVAMAIVQGSYFYTISKIQVAAAILLQYLAPIFVAIFSMCFWKERLTFVKLIALLFALGGCYLVVGGYNLQLLQMNRMGIAGGLISAISFAGYTLLGERGMHRYPPWTILFYALAFAALTWHIIYPPFHYLTVRFSAVQWIGLLYITVVGTVLPFGLFFVGVNYIRATRASITATLEPISAGFIAFFALGEKMDLLQIVGGTLVIAAVILLQFQQEQDEMAPVMIRTKGK
jgi:drug/metabolite transporter (DMT)-like permease